MNSLVGVTARLVRAPALHFLTIGCLLFLADGWWQQWRDGQAGVAPQQTIVITAEQVEQIREDFLAQHGVAPTPKQLTVAVDDAIDEEVLFRQARAIGLDRDNAAVRKRLVQIARFVSEEPDQDEQALYRTALRLQLDSSDTVVRRHLAMLMRLAAANAPMAGEAPPDDADLEAYLQRHHERFMSPWRGSLTHVYFSDDLRGDGAEADARRVLDQLRGMSLDPQAAVELGDPFLLGHHLKKQTRQELRQVFGGMFADSAVQIAPGVWSEPVRSGYGWHLVWVREVQPPTMPALAAARERALRGVLEERREWRVQETLKSMRADYAIEVQLPATGEVASMRTDENG